MPTIGSCLRRGLPGLGLALLVIMLAVGACVPSGQPTAGPAPVATAAPVAEPTVTAPPPP